MIKNSVCRGSGLCEHGRQRSQCKDCGGSGLCEHGRRKSRCKECGGKKRNIDEAESTDQVRSDSTNEGKNVKIV